MSRSSHAYSDDPRADVLPFLPDHARTVLDVGCWAGGFGHGLKQRRPDVEVWGVERDEEAASVAATRLDKVVYGTFPVDLPAAYFDCVVFNDVLEHLANPWDALDEARRLLRSDGIVVATIPNVRHFSVSLRLVLRGKWQYEPAGILDRTHLRFFTRSSILDLFAGRAFTVSRIEAGEVSDPRGRFRVVKLAALMGATGTEFLAKKYYVVASPIDTSGP